MPSSFTTSIGLEKPGTGEQSGTWGATVNENSDIIDVSINGVRTLSLSGTSSTLTTTDGAVSDGHYKVLVLSGSPPSAHTITIAPNTANKLYFVNNTTAQSVIFTQGSGGNATITAGETAIIYANGAGATSAVVNLSNDFGLSSPEITGGTINSTPIGATTPSTGAFTTLSATGANSLTGTTTVSNLVATTADINGGTVDGAVIGSAAAAAATVTTLTATGTAQITGAVGIGGAANASAQLDVASTTRGLLIPRMTTTQRDAIASPAAGLVVYNTTTARYNINNGAWVELPLIGSGGAQAFSARLTNIASTGLVTADIAATALTTAAETIALNISDTQVPTSAAVDQYVTSRFNVTGSAPVFAIRAFGRFNGVPISGTYTRSGTTVTCSITGHGMVTGNFVHIAFTTGTATSGYYPVTFIDVNTFTITDPASGTTSGNVTALTRVTAAGNISTILRNNTGDYTITYATAAPTVSYAFSWSYTNEINVQHTVGFLSTTLAESTRINHYNATNSAQTADKSGVAFMAVW